MFYAERSVEIFLHLIRLFSPSCGSVINPFAGPMTVALACLKTSRSCVSIEDSTPAMKYAIARLRVYATPTSTMEKLYTYVDEVDLTDSDTSETPVQVPVAKYKEASVLRIFSQHKAKP